MQSGITLFISLSDEANSSYHCCSQGLLCLLESSSPVSSFHAVCCWYISLHLHWSMLRLCTLLALVCMACANALLLYHCSHGCDPVVPDVAGRVALQYACSKNCGSCVREICAAPGTKQLTVSGTNKHIVLVVRTTGISTTIHIYSLLWSELVLYNLYGICSLWTYGTYVNFANS